MTSPDSFTARGGWWVAAQVPVLIGAALIPLATGAGALMPGQGLQWAGVAATMLGLAITAAGLLALGDALTPFPRPRQNAALRTHGIYARVRHPVYGGLIIASLGWSLWWLSALGAVYALLVFVFFDRKSAREEIWLAAKFPGYADYRRRVRKLIPLVY